MAGNVDGDETVATPASVDKKIKKVHDEKKLKNLITRAKPGPIKYLILLSKLLSFLLSLPIIAFIVWLIYMREYDCESLLKLPQLQIVIIIGLIIIFILNTISTFLRSRFPVLGFLIVMVPVIVMLTMGLGLIGSFNTQSRMIPGSPSWLKAKVGEDYNWNNIKSCVYNTRTCEHLLSRSNMLKAYEFNKLKLSYIENGCCRPPSHCNMEFINATYWQRDDYGLSLSSGSHDIECDLWRNNENILCNNCYSCKDGFRKMIQTKWWTLGNFLVVMAVLLTISHLFLFLGTMWERHHYHH